MIVARMMELAETQPNGAGASWADFIALDDDDLRELVDGELVEIEVPTEQHGYVVACLSAFLWNWASEHGGMVLGSGYKVRISDRRGAMPDVQYFRPGNVRGHGEQGLEEGAPDLAVEVVSPSSRRYDRVAKLAWYASIGVSEYWVVDPEAQIIERLGPDADAGLYRIEEAAAGDATFSPASFPGLEVPLARLWTLPE